MPKDWATLCPDLTKKLVPGVGIEPTLPKEQDFKSCAYTNFATRAKLNNFTTNLHFSTSIFLAMH